MKVNYKEVCVVTRCPICGRGNEVEVNEMDYLDWQDGVLAQVAFPYLSANEREALISGICPTCWENMFGGDAYSVPQKKGKGSYKRSEWKKGE